MPGTIKAYRRGRVTLLAIAIPLNIGYAQIAGMPPSECPRH
jgi:hypothetical protein